MGAGASSRSAAADEASAIETLRLIEDGSKCLAGDSHSWRTYEGQIGTGRVCEHCFTAEDTRSKPSKIVFRIRPDCSHLAQPTAVAILSLWRAELERCATGELVDASPRHAVWEQVLERHR